MATKAANRARKRRKRRLKKSVKMGLYILFVILAVGIYAGISVYISSKEPDPHGDMGEADTSGKIDEILEETDAEEANYWILNAGDGEALFITLGETEVLIDTGSAKSAENVVKEVKANVKGKLDYVILTNADAKRTGGVEKLYKEVEVANTITGSLGSEEGTIKSLIGDNGKITKGVTTSFEIGEQALLTIMKPDVTSDDERDQSLMVIFEYGDTRFISESDAGPEEEAKILGSFTECDVLVFARHGSKESNRIDLGERYGIVTATKNSGLPDDYILKNHRGVFSTGVSGTIKFVTDGTLVTTELDTGQELKEE